MLRPPFPRCERGYNIHPAGPQSLPVLFMIFFTEHFKYAIVSYLKIVSGESS